MADKQFYLHRKLTETGIPDDAFTGVRIDGAVEWTGAETQAHRDIADSVLAAYVEGEEVTAEKSEQEEVADAQTAAEQAYALYVDMQSDLDAGKNQNTADGNGITADLAAIPTATAGQVRTIVGNILLREQRRNNREAGLIVMLRRILHILKWLVLRST